MRLHFYLITEDKIPEVEGLIEIRERRDDRAAKNEETTRKMVGWNDDHTEREDEWIRKVVSCGYHDFADEAEYNEHIGEVTEQKLNEIDETYLDKAGVELEGLAKRNVGDDNESEGDGR